MFTSRAPQIIVDPKKHRCSCNLKNAFLVAILGLNSLTLNSATAEVPQTAPAAPIQTVEMPAAKPATVIAPLESEHEKKMHSKDAGSKATTEVNVQTKIQSKYLNPQGQPYEVDPD